VSHYSQWKRLSTLKGFGHHHGFYYNATPEATPTQRPKTLVIGGLFSLFPPKEINEFIGSYFFQSSAPPRFHRSTTGTGIEFSCRGAFSGTGK